MVGTRRHVVGPSFFSEANSPVQSPLVSCNQGPDHAIAKNLEFPTIFLGSVCSAVEDFSGAIGAIERDDEFLLAFHFVGIQAHFVRTTIVDSLATKERK